jgi:hypothetical protein
MGMPGPGTLMKNQKSRHLAFVTVALALASFAEAQLRGADSLRVPRTTSAKANAADAATIGAEHAAEDTSGAGATPRSLSATLNRAEIAAQIRGASGPARDIVYRQVEAIVETASTALRELRRRSGELRSGPRGEIINALQEVRAREQGLRQSLKSARRANADTVTSAQEKLASDYEAYADAVSAAEEAARSSDSAGAPRAE